MAEASRTMVVLEELNEAAGQLIAEHTGAEAGLVTSGAAAGLTLQAAAVIAGDDPDRIALLPEAAHNQNRIVIKRSHHSEFTQAWRQGGARLVWVGSEDTCLDWEIESAISGETAALGVHRLTVAPRLVRGAVEVCRDRSRSRASAPRRCRGHASSLGEPSPVHRIRCGPGLVQRRESDQSAAVVRHTLRASGPDCLGQG